MKQRIIIGIALLLLLVVIGFMVWDFFLSRPEGAANPYAYDLSELKKSDTALNRYEEALQFTPGLEEIHGIAVDPAGRIFVAGKNGVKVFDDSGKLLRKFKFDGYADCITLGLFGNILLGMGDHVEIYSAEGKLLEKWKPANSESVITSIAATGLFVFVADAGAKVVYRYDHSGKLFNRIGEKDPENRIPGFIIPSPYFDVCIGKKGELWVANTGRHELEQFSPDGRLVTSWGVASMAIEGFAGCCNPSHFAILADGSFVTAEKGIERVKIYSPGGVLKCVVATPEQFEEGTKGLDLAVDPKGRLLVLDPVRNQVRIFVEKLKKK